MSLDTQSVETGPARESGPRSARPGHQRTSRTPGSAEASKLKAALASAGERVRAKAPSQSAWRRRAVSTPSAIRRAYLRMLAPLHHLWRDRQVEKLLFKPSSGGALRPDTQPDADRPIYDGPVPGQVFDWVIGSFDVTLREFAFVDFRAGSGRTLLYAAMHDFDRVIGYEYTPSVYEDAQLNISQFPRTLMKCRDVECRRGDRGDIVIPDQPLVLFFPNAGRERFLSLILDHVSASYRLNPRRIYMIMENAAAMPAFGHEDIFREEQQPLATRLKLKLFSPVDISVYRSIA